MGAGILTLEAIALLEAVSPLLPWFRGDGSLR
jgi:hypothetical protein